MVLDHIENISIEQNGTIQNFHSIPQLKEGIFMVYHAMVDLERNYWHIRYPDKTPEMIELLKGSTLSFSGELNRADAIAVNLFHWYSVNVINYAKCCALVKFVNQKGILPEYLAKDKSLLADLKKTRDNYIKNIPELSPVKHFRDKAGAHLAYADPHKNDNPATLVESISIIPTMEHGRISIGGMTRSRGQHASSFGDHQWNIIDNFHQLVPRYFKDNMTT